MIRICLPFPHRDLSPNARVHWSTHAKRAKAARQDAYYATREQRAAPIEWRKDFEPLPVKLTFCPPDGRARDTDNMLSSCKAYLDGIADAIGVDDSRWQLSIGRGEPVTGGAVVVEVGP